jgi:hypothetical protein
MNELKNYNYCEETISLKKTIESSFLEMGKRLRDIRDKRLYEPQWTSFPEYLAEMKLSESQASKLINIYNKFVLEYQFTTEEILQTGGWAVLAEVLPVIRDKESATEWLEKAKNLTMQDLRIEVKERKTGKSMDGCKHENTYTITICRDCGNKQREYENE